MTEETNVANPVLESLMAIDAGKVASDLPEAQRQDIVDMQKNNQVRALDRLTPTELEQAKQLATQLDENNAQSVISYGNTAEQKIGNFSQSVLSKVQGKDLGEVGTTLTDLMFQLQESNPQELIHDDKQNVLSKLFKKAKRSIFEITQKYQKLGAGIDKISAKLTHEQAGLLEDNETLEGLYNENLNFFKALNVYIAGAELKMEELEQTIIPRARQLALEAGSEASLATQQVADLEAYKNRLDKRTHDLRLSRQVTIQQAPQIRLIQNTNQELAEKIQSSINTAIPLWKNQVAIALTLLKQKDALASQRMVSTTTNDLLKKNSEMLKTSAIEAAEENERGFIEVDTLKTTQANLIETIQETLRIQSEGAQKRRQSELELAQMEEEIKSKLLEFNQ